MKNFVSVILSLAFLFATPVRAQWAAVLAGKPPAAVGYSFTENFETATTGYENSGWTTYNSGNPAATVGTMGFAAGQGSQSLYAPTGALNGAYRSDAITGEKWFYWMQYNATDVVNDLQFYGDAAQTGLKLGFQGGKLYMVVGGSDNTDSGSAFPLDQWVHVWVRYKPGSGTASGDAYFSTTGIRPGSPQCTITGATSTAEADRPWWLSRSTYAVAWDHIIINATAIGNNP